MCHRSRRRGKAAGAATIVRSEMRNEIIFYDLPQYTDRYFLIDGLLRRFL